MRKVFVDTGAFLALRNRSEDEHELRPGHGAPLAGQLTGPCLTTDPAGVLTASLGRANLTGTAVWLDDATPAFAPRGGDRAELRLYDLSLNLRASVPGWNGASPVLHKGALSGLSRGGMQTAPLPSGPVRLVREFDGAEVKKKFRQE